MCPISEKHIERFLFNMTCSVSYNFTKIVPSKIAIIKWKLRVLCMFYFSSFTKLISISFIAIVTYIIQKINYMPYITVTLLFMKLEYTLKQGCPTLLTETYHVPCRLHLCSINAANKLYTVYTLQGGRSPGVGLSSRALRGHSPIRQSENWTIFSHLHVT